MARVLVDKKFVTKNFMHAEAIVTWLNGSILVSSVYSFINMVQPIMRMLVSFSQYSLTSF